MALSSVISRPALESCLSSFSFSLAQVEHLYQFLLLVEQWNLSHGLLARGELPRLLDRHLVDSLSLSSFLPASGAGIDLGSGNGFPALVLAILHPSLNFTLTESNQKKARFLRYVIHRLMLSHVVVYSDRIESLTNASTFTFATSRAFSSLLNSCHYLSPLLSSGGKFFAMKGFHVEHDLSEFSSSSVAGLYSSPEIHVVSPESKIILLTRQ
ncbi:MAG: 16S rRNA (guanine(527)-N(7))-methyltransferase RsmG [Magnetococcales bacterium]|nr:16S rRNA (guanine(527)-N(7))-methyltransferase RsmG [Magnetococcales bacterium]